ncbi:hypothetical protein ACFTSD_02530 [Nocardiaceae bacterium NPDC056970]
MTNRQVPATRNRKSALTPGQIRLIGELAPWQIYLLVRNPKDQCRSIREGQGGGSLGGDWPASYWRKTYPWGIAVTTSGDYFSKRKVDASEHLATVTWGELTTWAKALPADVLAEVERTEYGNRESLSRFAALAVGSCLGVPGQLALF